MAKPKFEEYSVTFTVPKNRETMRLCQALRKWQERYEKELRKALERSIRG